MASGSATPPAGEPPREPAGAGGRDAPTAGEPGAPPPGESGAPPPGTERYGPLRVLRTHKDDGRALTLYSRAPREEPATPGAGESPAAEREA